MRGGRRKEKGKKKKERQRGLDRKSYWMSLT
jgi:hypothetical protein